MNTGRDGCDISASKMEMIKKNLYMQLACLEQVADDNRI